MRKRGKIISLFLVAQILFIGPLGRDAYPWGAFVGVLGIKTAATHQEILKAAYQLLRLDPAWQNPRNLYLSEKLGITLDEILKYEGVYVDIWNVSTGGPGPDVEGATPYSWHWYNPATKLGKAPEAASDQFYEFAQTLLGIYKIQENGIRGMTWSAHFLADMFVPYHLNGISASQATDRIDRQWCVLTTDESGPFFLRNKTPTTEVPAKDDVEMMLLEGHGLNANFRAYFESFETKRLQAAVIFPDNNPVDWFDPWYWNGNFYKDLNSSHVTYEANAHNAWVASGGYGNSGFNTPPYDPLWHNYDPDYKFEGTSVRSQAAMAYLFTRGVAARNKKDIQSLFLSPVVAIRKAIEAVYTLWRSSFSALEPKVMAYPDPERPGYLLIKSSIYNYAPEQCQNTMIRLTIKKDGRVLIQDTQPLNSNISMDMPGEMTWTYQTDLSQKLDIYAEVVGAFTATPDLQYSISMFTYFPVNQPQDQGPRVFGDDKWSQNAFTGDIYYLPEGTSKLPDFTELHPVGKIYTKSLNIPERPFDSGFPNVTSRFEWFAISYNGTINITAAKAGQYSFLLTSDDGSRLIIDNNIVIDNDGTHPTTTKPGSVFLNPGVHLMRIDYFQGPRLYVALILWVKPPGASEFNIFNKDDY